jgi:hypothetical protein
VGLLLLWGGCAGPASDAQPGAAALFAVPVSATEPRDFAAFNNRVAEAVAQGKEWPGDPAMVVRQFAGWRSERLGALALEGSGERPSRYEVVAIADGFLDDSVRGERFDLSLERVADETWRVTAAKASWRCWPERGHEDFGTVPCS